MMSSPRSDRPRIYADEDIDRPLIGALRARGFGNLAAFVNGNMFKGLFGADVGVKLGDADQSQLPDAAGGPFGPTQRPMGGYVTLPAAMTSAEAKGLGWQVLEYVGALPPKKPKSAKKT